MSTDAQRRASAKYDQQNAVIITLKLNRKTDADLIDWLARENNKQGYIKQLIRADAARRDD